MADRLAQPVKILVLTLGMVLIASMMGIMQSTTGEGTQSVFSVVVVLGVSGIIVSPLVQVIQDITAMISQIGEFITGFVPVYAGVVAASGKPLSAFAYQGVLVTVIQVISFLTTNILIPLICLYLALSVSSAATHKIKVGGIANAIRSAVVWCLGLFLTVFVSLLTIKGFVAGAADSVTFRTGKFLVGSRCQRRYDGSTGFLRGDTVQRGRFWDFGDRADFSSGGHQPVFSEYRAENFPGGKRFSGNVRGKRAVGIDRVRAIPAAGGTDLLCGDAGDRDLFDADDDKRKLKSGKPSLILQGQNTFVMRKRW